MNQNRFRPVVVARLFFILLTTVMATYVALDTHMDPLTLTLIGFGVAVFLVLVEYASNAIASRKIIFAVLGWMFGLCAAQLFYPSFGWLAGKCIEVFNNLLPRSLYTLHQSRLPPNLVTKESAEAICSVLFGYFGLVMALRHADWLRLGNLKFYLTNPSMRPKVLDSSVIIDGRIAELTTLGLLEGPILVPNFVLNEIQMLGDASDSHRRSRGRRGLEVLDKLRTNCRSLDIIATDYADIQEVDEKLVRLCREMDGELVTNDFNLQKIAQLHQIQTLNLNELASALKPTVYIGESVELKIVKTGKEPGQGVGYLEDGTMVVVDGADHLLGQNCEITIISILQNPSGRLIFARLQEENRRMRA